MRKTRMGAMALAGVFVLTSCGAGRSVERGVGVSKIPTNVGLGIEVAAAAPANIQVPKPSSKPVVQPTVQPIPEFTIPPFETLPPPVVKPCPPAGAFDFPAIETGVEPKPDVRPKTGDYPWKLDGSATSGGEKQKVDMFETRRISDIKPDPSAPNAFTFKQSQPSQFDDSRRGTITTTFKMVPTGAAAAAANDSGRGLFIVSISFDGIGPNGKRLQSTFTPIPSVQMMAFPVVDGDGVAGATPQTGTPLDTSTGTDPASGAQLKLKGNVHGKKQVDACGKRVDSWFVDAEETFTYTDTTTGQTESLDSNYDYGVAIQFGGMLVFEHTDSPIDGPTLQLDSRVATVPKVAKK